MHNDNSDKVPADLVVSGKRKDSHSGGSELDPWSEMCVLCPAYTYKHLCPLHWKCEQY